MLLITPAIEAGKVSPVEVARTFSSVPSAPAILVKLSQLLRDGASSLGEIGRVVRLDPGLACRVLRACSETSLSLEMPCLTIEDAINHLGASGVREIVAEVTRSQVLDLPLESYGLDADDFWRRSVATAIGAEVLAEHTGDDVDLAYTVGLLHGVGMFAVDAWAQREMPGIIFSHRAWPRDYSASEGAVLGFTHAEVSATLLNLWHLSRAITEPIRNQNTPLRTGAHSRATCLMHISKWLAAAVCMENGVPPLPDHRFLDVLRITSYELVRLVVELRIRLGSARQSLRTLAA